MSEFPTQRVDGLIMTEAGGDLLVYDQQAAALHTLNAFVQDVWHLCDGVHNAEDIVRETGAAHGDVIHTLNQLSAAKLVEGYDPPEGTSTRRRLVKRAGVVAVPAIVSISAPAAANHESGKCHPPGSRCATDEECCGVQYPNNYCLPPRRACAGSILWWVLSR